MKKCLLAWLLVMLMLAAVPAMAHDGSSGRTCSCPESVGVYYEYPTYYMSTGDHTHILLEKELLFCNRCGAPAGRGSDVNLSDHEPHVFSGNTCIYCGHVDSQSGGMAPQGVQATLRQVIASRTGPSTSYTEPGSFLRAGDVVTVRTKVWDERNEIWWVQVEFAWRDQLLRVYTGAKRLNVDLSRVPEEYALGEGSVITYTDAYAGPDAWAYRRWDNGVPRNTAVTLYEVENGYAHVEYWDSASWQNRRVWVPLSATNFAGYYDAWGYWGSADDEPTMSITPTQTRSPSTYYGDTAGYPVGEWCQVIASSAHVREWADTDAPTVGYVKQDQWYEILGCTTGSTGKDWYQIYVDGEYGWISSGLVVLQ